MADVTEHSDEPPAEQADGQPAHLSRDDRRRRTEAAIRTAARDLFAEKGFERTTIRGVAAAAGVDPALVMQHFGSKEKLFAAASHWKEDHARILAATSDSLPSVALTDLFDSFESPMDREATVALMRNCLTHPSAAKMMRDDVMCDRQAAIAGTMSGTVPAAEAELRAGLFGACMIGLGMARYLLELEPVAAASQEDLRRVMEPVLRALMAPPADEDGTPTSP